MNTFGRFFRVTTWGESHGPAVGCVVDGCPSNLELTEADVQRQLDRRRPGQSDVTTSRGEDDSVEILSGVFEARTTGSPISMLVHNLDKDSSKYREFIHKPRPGHADLTWRMKYGHVDYRGGGRSSARETVGRVAAGAVAGKILDKVGVQVTGYTKQIGSVKSDESLDASMKGVADLIDSNPVRALDIVKAKEMEAEIKLAKKAGDSVGGVVECVALNVPAGLGEPVFGKLTADFASALASIPGCKGVEFGVGFESASMKGSQVNDEFSYVNGKVVTKTNNSGGMQGGISNGMPVVVRCVFKPTSSISKRQSTVDLNLKKNAYLTVTGRHDPCIVPRAVPVVESMVRLVLVDQMMASALIPRKI